MDNSSNYILYLQNLLTQHHIHFLSQQELHQTSLKQQVQTNVPPPHPGHHHPTLPTNMKHPLTGPLIQRYSRQMLLKQISYEGQLKIIQSKIAIIGAGGIGCPLGLYLAAAGTGTIGLFDSDAVEITNLHRQVGHRTDRLGMPKTKSLKQTLLSINPHINIEQHPFITVQTVNSLDDYDLIIDGSDNPKCRYIVNDYCMKRGKKLLSGACIGWEAQITCYGGDNLCYRCLWGNEQVSLGGCSTLGVVGMIPGIVGLLLATQALKMILTGESSLQGKLLTYDGRTSEFKKMSLRKKKPECIGCGQNKLNIETYNYSMYNTCSTASVVEGVQQISWSAFLNSQLDKQIILDVRPSSLFNIVHFEGSANVPLDALKKMNRDQVLDLLKLNEGSLIPVTCARGITSRAAAHYLTKLGLKAISISGGLQSYQRQIDTAIPIL